MTNCKSCGAEVEWKKIERRWYCFNAGTTVDHWDACSKRKWNQVVSTGKRFDTEEASGYKNSIHGDKFDRLSHELIIGAKYKPDGCTCGLPPWELCKPDCEHAIGG